MHAQLRSVNRTNVCRLVMIDRNRNFNRNSNFNRSTEILTEVPKFQFSLNQYRNRKKNRATKPETENYRPLMQTREVAKLILTQATFFVP